VIQPKLIIPARKAGPPASIASINKPDGCKQYIGPVSRQGDNSYIDDIPYINASRKFPDFR